MLSQAHLAQDTTSDLAETVVTLLGFPRNRQQFPIRNKSWLAGGFSEALWRPLTRHRAGSQKHIWRKILSLICSFWLRPESLCRDFCETKQIANHDKWLARRRPFRGFLWVLLQTTRGVSQATHVAQDASADLLLLA